MSLCEWVCNECVANDATIAIVHFSFARTRFLPRSMNTQWNTRPNTYTHSHMRIRVHTRTHREAVDFVFVRIKHSSPKDIRCDLNWSNAWNLRQSEKDIDAQHTQRPFKHTEIDFYSYFARAIFIQTVRCASSSSLAQRSVLVMLCDRRTNTCGSTFSTQPSEFCLTLSAILYHHHDLAALTFVVRHFSNRVLRFHFLFTCCCCCVVYVYCFFPQSFKLNRTFNACISIFGGNSPIKWMLTKINATFHRQFQKFVVVVVVVHQLTCTTFRWIFWC